MGLKPCRDWGPLSGLEPESREYLFEGPGRKLPNLVN